MILKNNFYGIMGKRVLFILIFTLCMILTACKKQDTPGTGNHVSQTLNTVSGDSKSDAQKKFQLSKNESGIVMDGDIRRHIFRSKIHLKLSIPYAAEDLFTPVSDQNHDYRYGPSIMLDKRGRLNIWLAAPGNGQGELDWITYRYSDDSGATWSKEELALRPDPGSLDALSVCDPDVFFYEGYYYIGYTSTINDTAEGLCNSLFIARSENPNGPFEKWNGTGWGGKPYPLIYYDGSCMGWGCGEPSFVVMNDTLYIYSTRDSYTADYTRIKCTEVRTADLKESNWPNRLEYRGVAVVRTENGEDSDYEFRDCDSWDVSYVEGADMFLALCVNRRFEEDSCLLYFESEDGVNFERVSEINENVICGCHNCGLSGDERAHIKKGDPVLIGYAYSGTPDSPWGVWALKLAPALIQVRRSIDRSEELQENLKKPIDYGVRPGQGFDTPEETGTIRDTNRNIYGITEFIPYFTNIDISLDQAFAAAIRPVARFGSGYLSELSLDEIARLGMTFRVEDESVCTVRNDCIIEPHSKGTTTVTVYKGEDPVYDVCVNVY